MPQLISLFQIYVTVLKRHDTEKNLWYLVNNIPTYFAMKPGKSTGNLN